MKTNHLFQEIRKRIEIQKQVKQIEIIKKSKEFHVRKKNPAYSNWYNKWGEIEWVHERKPLFWGTFEHW